MRILSLFFILFPLLAFSQEKFEYDAEVNDYFDANNHNWPVGEEGKGEAEFKDQVYFLKHSGSKGFSAFTTEFILDPRQNFTLGTKMRSVWGPLINSHGLVWGMKDKANYLAFVINPEKSYRIYGYFKDELFVIKDWTPFRYIYEQDEWNELELKKNDKNLEFYINSRKVHESEFDQLFGNQIGFTLNGKQHVEVEYLKIFHPYARIRKISDARKGYKKEKLDVGINSTGNEASVTVSADGKKMYVSRKNHNENMGGLSDTDAYVADRQPDGNWSSLRNLGKPVNNDGENIVTSISADGNMMLLKNEYSENGNFAGEGVSVSYKTRTSWTKPEPLNIQGIEEAEFDFSSFQLSPDQQTIVMSLKNYDSYGETDLYVSFRENDSTWSVPLNLGSMINTNKHEIAPFLAADKRTLYFSTNGRAGYGSQDIFVAKRLDDSWVNWTEPKNLGPEVNSTRFDAYYSVAANSDEAFFVSQNEASDDLDVFKIKVHEEAKPGQVAMLSGRVINDQTKKPMEAEIKYYDAETDEYLGSAHSSPLTGQYNLFLEKGRSYTVFAETGGFYPTRQTVSIPETDSTNNFSQNLVISSLDVGQKIRLNNIYFRPDKAELKQKSLSELKKLVQLMNDFPNMQIEIHGHTDRAPGVDTDFLTELSQKRAESVKDFLIRMGVSESRLKAKGYGGSMPIADNDSNETRKLNRRVEFEVLKK